MRNLLKWLKQFKADGSKFGRIARVSIPDSELEHDHPFGGRTIITTKFGGRTIITTKPTGTIRNLSSPPPGAVISAPPIASLSQGNKLSISSPDGVDSIVIEADGKTIIEAWVTKAAMVGDQEIGKRPVGALGFAEGITYIMTSGGWVNIGEALEKPMEMTNRRGAIRAQKARKHANG